MSKLQHKIYRLTFIRRRFSYRGLDSYVKNTCFWGESQILTKFEARPQKFRNLLMNQLPTEEQCKYGTKYIDTQVREMKHYACKLNGIDWDICSMPVSLIIC